MSARSGHDGRVPRSVVALVVAASLALVLASCGGDDDDDVSSATTTTIATTSTTEAASTVDVARYCQMEGEFNDLTVNVDTTDPAALQKIVQSDEYQALVDELFRVVPKELSDDVHLLNEPVQAFAESGDYDAFIDASGEQAMIDANARLQKFALGVC